MKLDRHSHSGRIDRVKLGSVFFASGSCRLVQQTMLCALLLCFGGNSGFAQPPSGTTAQRGNMINQLGGGSVSQADSNTNKLSTIESPTEPTALAAGVDRTADLRTRPEASAFGSQEMTFSSAQSPTEPTALAADVEKATGLRTRPEASAFGSQEMTFSSAQSQPQAVGLLQKVMEMVVLGPAFDALVRETVWTTGRKVVGVGTYEQAGGGSGCFNLQIIMYDGDGRHRLQQISDGRLAWTRSEVADQVTLRRVDVGRLDQWVKDATTKSGISPGLRVGAWAEILSQIERDHVLQVHQGKLKEKPVWIISGKLRQQRREEILAESQRQAWPSLHPTRVMIAVQSKQDPETGFGQLLPVRMEFWSDPIAGQLKTVAADQTGSAKKRRGRLIALIELYSIRPIQPPPEERFRFANQDAEVNFVNETDRYIEFHGVQLTERQRRQLRR